MGSEMCIRDSVWCRIGASVVEKSHGGVLKQDSVVRLTRGRSELVFPAKMLHESSGSFFRPYRLSEGSRGPVWDRNGASVVENSHGGVWKQDSVAPIDTVAVPNWCFLLRICTNRVTASSDLAYYPRDRGNQCGAGLGRQWLRIRMEEFRNRTVWSRLTLWPFRTGVSC